MAPYLNMLAEELLIDRDQLVRTGRALAEFFPLTDEQKRFFTSKAKTRWCFGGNQSGKSYCNLMDLTMQALEIHPFKETIPNGIHWVGIESWDLVKDILWDQYLSPSGDNGFLPSNRILRVQTEKEPRKVFLDNGHLIQFKAFNQGQNSFTGRAIHTFHGDEQCLHGFKGIKGEIEARLLKYNGEMSWSMTPCHAQPELEDIIEELPKTHEAFYLDLEDNRVSRGGYIADSIIDTMIDEWAEVEQVTRLKGRFSSYADSAFTEFTRADNTIAPFEFREDKFRFYRGIDFGWNHPFACVWLARDDGDHWYVYREYIERRKSHEEHIEMVKKLSGNEKYEDTFADPEDPQGIDKFRKAGIPITLANKERFSRREGFMLLKRLMKKKSSGYPNLYLFNTMKETIKEIVTTKWDPKEKGDIVKGNDHLLDALRYVLYTILKPRTKSLVIY